MDKDGKIDINMQYPLSDEYEYESKLIKINLDDERISDITSGNGFVITEPKSIKKDVKDPNGIFSTRYGRMLQDMDPFEDRYKCECGYLKSRIMHGIECPACHTLVKYVDDNFNYFGWNCLKDPYYIIHPAIHRELSYFIGGKKLERILCPIDEKDVDGFSSTNQSKPKDEPFFGIGMTEFKERFDEIITYYRDKLGKNDYYDDISKNRKNAFIQSIPVYTTHLRPFRIDSSTLFYEGTNAIYNMITKLVSQINKDNLKIFKKKKPKDQLLYDLQCKYAELYDELELTLRGKKGSLRSLFGGRFNFTGRCVITLDPTLRIDQLRLPYRFLCEVLQAQIINILHKSMNWTYSDAYKFWYRGHLNNMEPQICKIIESIIWSNPEGLPLLINRNPSINYGSLLQMFCVGINDDYTMSLSYGILNGLSADFDGDVLNILYIINQEFFKAANAVLNPRNSMYISKNDGYANMGVLPMRDILINANSLIYLSRDKYSSEQLARINSIKNRNKD